MPTWMGSSELMEAAAMPPVNVIGVEAHRAAVAASSGPDGGKAAGRAGRRPGLAEAQGPIRARLYAVAEGPTRASLLTGAVYVVGSIDTHDELVRAIANQSGWSVL
ncbi:hypothetical protein AB5I41_14220 [Sphingomonas sp. MMS24-JH45]